VAEAARPTVCVSGKLPSGRKKADCAEPLARAGYVLVHEVANALSVLMLAHPSSTSAKAEKARTLGVRIAGEAELQALVGEASAHAAPVPAPDQRGGRGTGGVGAGRPAASRVVAVPVVRPLASR